jgi:hypothetical protein
MIAGGNISRERARRWRKELGLSVYDVSTHTKILGWKLFKFESGHLELSIEDMNSLISFLANQTNINLQTKKRMA